MKLVFSYVVKGIKIIITAKFRAFRHLSFEDKKRTNMLTEMCLKSFGTFEKQAPDQDEQLFIVVTFFTCIDGVRILH